MNKDTIIRRKLNMTQNLSNVSIASDDAEAFVHHNSIGSIEGTIKTNRHSFRGSFDLHQSTSRKVVRCDFPETMRDEIEEALKKRHRVAVSGVISYNSLGEPLSVDVQKPLRILRRESELPTPAEMVGLALDLTGDLDTEEYIESLRNS